MSSTYGETLICTMSKAFDNSTARYALGFTLLLKQ